MNSERQLPLFSAQPQSEADLGKDTPLKYVYDLFAEYLKREGKTENTIKAFVADMRLVGVYAGEDTTLAELQSTKVLEKYLRWLEYERGVPCSNKSYSRRVTTLKSFFRWLHAIEVLNSDPAKPILQRSRPAPLSYALIHDEVDRMLRFSRLFFPLKDEMDLRPEFLVLLLWQTGIKKGEAMRLTVKDVNQKGTPYIHVHQTSQNEYKERKILVDREWVQLYRDYKDQYGLRNQLFTCTPRNLEYILADLGKGAGVPVRVSFEVMRWSCAVRDIRAGMDPEAVREKLGISHITWQETSYKIQRLIKAQIAREETLSRADKPTRRGRLDL